MSDGCLSYLHMPTPREKRLARNGMHIQEHLDDMKTLQEWAKELGYDQRTLHRLFMQELGMSFLQWRQQAKLLAALEWLAEGRQVLGIALDLGYQTQSAFTAMFRRKMGITPSDFVRRSEEHTSELQSLMRLSYAVFCLKKKTRLNHPT